jgi:hypothetical protein
MSQDTHNLLWLRATDTKWQWLLLLLQQLWLNGKSNLTTLPAELCSAPAARSCVVSPLANPGRQKDNDGPGPTAVITACHNSSSSSIQQRAIEGKSTMNAAARA